MWLRLCLAALISLIALPAQPGPWPREPGQYFATGSITSDLHLSQWLEIGLRPGHWLSFQGDHAVDYPTTLAFSYHRSLKDFGQWKTSASLGVVLRGPDYNAFHWHMTRPIGPFQKRTVVARAELGLQLGAAIGRPMSWPKPGWLALQARYRHGPFLRQIKAEATWGIRPTEKLALIGQFNLSKGNSQDLFAEIVASGVYRLTRIVSLEIGLSQPLIGGDKPTAKLGTWIEF